MEEFAETACAVASFFAEFAFGGEEGGFAGVDAAGD